MTLDLDAIEKLAAEATAGPWQLTFDGNRNVVTHSERGWDSQTVCVIETDMSRGDAAFIAEARAAVPLLCKRVRELEALVAAYEADHVERWEQSAAELKR